MTHIPSNKLNDVFIQEELNHTMEWLSQIECPNKNVKWKVVQPCDIKPFKPYYAGMVQYIIRGNVRCKIVQLLNYISQKLLMDLLWMFNPEKYTLFV